MGGKLSLNLTVQTLKLFYLTPNGRGNKREWWRGQRPLTMAAIPRQHKGRWSQGQEAASQMDWLALRNAAWWPWVQYLHGDHGYKYTQGYWDKWRYSTIQNALCSMGWDALIPAILPDFTFKPIIALKCCHNQWVFVYLLNWDSNLVWNCFSAIPKGKTSYISPDYPKSWKPQTWTSLGNGSIRIRECSDWCVPWPASQSALW